jgi:hypothetical protein
MRVAETSIAFPDTDTQKPVGGQCGSPMALIRIFPWFKSSIPETRIYRCANCSNLRYSTIEEGSRPPQLAWRVRLHRGGSGNAAVFVEAGNELARCRRGGFPPVQLGHSRWCRRETLAAPPRLADAAPPRPMFVIRGECLDLKARESGQFCTDASRPRRARLLKIDPLS